MKVFFDKDSERYEKYLSDREGLLKISPDDERKYAERILQELREEFLRLGKNPGYHVSAIGQPDASGWDGGLCIHEEDGHWLVYHSERGNRMPPEIFSSIQSAANYFLWMHVAHPSGGNTDVGMIPRLKGC